MSKRDIPENIKLILMGKAAGKCEFRGCEDSVIEDILTKKRGNYSNFAHIVADSKNGPRGDEVLSDKLCKEESNIMVLCRKHHKMIDDNPELYTKELLTEMKLEHEKYIEDLMKISNENSIVAVKYSFSVSNRAISINDDDIRRSAFKQRKYCSGDIINLADSKYDEKDDGNLYKIECENMENNFFRIVKPLLKKDNVLKIFLYAIAPQPLLIYLGMLFSDISNVEVQQLQREPIQEWYLNEELTKEFDVKMYIPEKKHSKVALNISITGDISEKRIRDVMGEDCDIIKIESSIHGNDIIKSKNQLEIYKKIIREAYEKIKDVYGRDCKISIFPAMPVSIAVETGRCWMKKTHPDLIIYDEKNGFKKCLEIKGGV